MVKMRVCQQNRLQRQPLLLQRGQQPFGVRGGVNNDSTAAFFRAHQIAVGGQRPQRKRLNVHSFSLFQIVRVDDQRHRPVVFRHDLHIGSEFAVLRRQKSNSTFINF